MQLLTIVNVGFALWSTRTFDLKRKPAKQNEPSHLGSNTTQRKTSHMHASQSGAFRDTSATGFSLQPAYLWSSDVSNYAKIWRNALREKMWYGHNIATEHGPF